jgi:hypothetical protein
MCAIYDGSPNLIVPPVVPIKEIHMNTSHKDASRTRSFSALKSLPVVALVTLNVLCGSVTVWATPILGTAQNFAILGASTVTNTGSTILWGDLGLYAGTSYTGGGSVTQTGAVHITDGVAQQGQLDALKAYNALAGLSTTRDLSGIDLGSFNSSNALIPGIYKFSSSAQLTGALYLDAQSNANALWVFQIGSTLTTASASSVNVVNGVLGADYGLYWQVGSSATLGTSTAFEGNILADQSITLNTTATMLCGRAIALNGAVTMDTNTVSNDCLLDNISGPSDYGSKGNSGGVISSSVPEPATLALFGLGLLGFGFSRRQKTDVIC